ncbi:hypothetical protein [Vulcanisaeta sp. JCM 16159]|uniref:hypothetical protein n=1 Tax=Vulcanisaeta sp. JCM 16159 TaxID=1295371 RepID=UPI001FB1DD41|nr:hypothetical protein [Vulcanisaeta sp. JCM 16159]
MLFRVVINSDVEIRREWPWDRVSRVKDRLKELGFRWNGEYWSGKVYSVSLIRELKELLELTSEETEKLMKTILVNSSGGVIGVEDLGSLGSIPVIVCWVRRVVYSLFHYRAWSGTLLRMIGTI